MGEVSGLAVIAKTVVRQAAFRVYTQDFRLLTLIAFAMVPMALLLGARRTQPAV